jgi:hypothetical protein
VDLSRHPPEGEPSLERRAPVQRVPSATRLGIGSVGSIRGAAAGSPVGARLMEVVACLGLICCSLPEERSNNKMQRTSHGLSGGSPLILVLSGHDAAAKR